MRLAVLTPILAIAAAPLPAAAQSVEAAESAEFAWQGKAYSLAIPEGFCLPGKEYQAMSKQMAAGDSQNETVLHLRNCEEPSGHYILIKTPRAVPAMNLQKSTFIRLIAEQLNGDAVEEGKQVGARDVETMSDGKLKVDGRNYGYAGYDEDCAYMSGTLDVAAGQQMATTRAGSCITLVGTASFAVHTYDYRPDGESVDALRARSRGVANAISPQ